MEKLVVNTGYEKYPIYIKDDFADLGEVFQSTNLIKRKLCVVTDTHVSSIFAGEIESILKPLARAFSVFVMPAGEENKNIDVLQDIYKHFQENELDRESIIVALGGGVVGDIAGFAAATFMRGISFVQLPTTLLSQVDSSVGGKVAVDFMGYKNQIGSFYQPKFVYSSLSALHTLPIKEFTSGLCEVIKHGLISDAEYLNFIINNKEKIKNLRGEAIGKIIYDSCKIKADIVSKDEKEHGLRKILNFGHTFGHGIESVSGFAISHGHSVALGTMAAMHLSKEMGMITTTELDMVEELYRYFHIPVKIKGYSAEDIYMHMKRDKKNIDDNIHLVLLKKMGVAYVDNSVQKKEILDALASIEGENECIS